jgi:hypothetical protein
MPQLQPVRPTTQTASEKIQHLRRLAFLLDNSIPIPGTQFRFGLDPILGLLGIAAGSGDVMGGVVGAYIISQAAQMGVPSGVVWQMVGNILMDSLVGLVPGLGDLLDFTWKANTRNINLLDQHFQPSSTSKKGHPLFVFGITLLTVLIVIGCAFLTLLLIKTILQLLS